MSKELAPKIIKIVEANERVDYNLVLAVVIVYFAVFWLIVSLWVFNDARKRYKSRVAGLLWGLIVFTMNIPLLILYLVLRPDPLWEQMENELNNGDIHLPLLQLNDGRRIVITLEEGESQVRSEPTKQATPNPELPTSLPPKPQPVTVAKAVPAQVKRENDNTTNRKRDRKERRRQRKQKNKQIPKQEQPVQANERKNQTSQQPKQSQEFSIVDLTEQSNKQFREATPLQSAEEL